MDVNFIVIFKHKLLLPLSEALAHCKLYFFIVDVNFNQPSSRKSPCVCLRPSLPANAVCSRAPWLSDSSSPQESIVTT